jgi:hypothetical protein
MPSIISILGEDKGGEKEGSSPDGELESVAKELIDAVKSEDVAGVVSALKACYACMESSEPTEE